MSSSPLILVFAALTVFLVLPGATAFSAQAGSVADLLLKDDIPEAEALLGKQPRTDESVALRGEIEFRKGNFERAADLYKQAMAMEAKNERAHFGLG